MNKHYAAFGALLVVGGVAYTLTLGTGTDEDARSAAIADDTPIVVGPFPARPEGLIGPAPGPIGGAPSAGDPTSGDEESGGEEPGGESAGASETGETLPPPAGGAPAPEPPAPAVATPVQPTTTPVAPAPAERPMQRGGEDFETSTVTIPPPPYMTGG